MKIAVILGTRPEIIRLSSLIRKCNNSKDFFVLHTGQHYSHNLDDIFFKELCLPPPKYNLMIGSGSHAEETAKMILGIEKILQIERPDIVIVQGDTNTVLAGSLASAKLNLKLGHVEAGVRSYNKSMPEEINRIIVDHISDFLFAPTKNAKDILLNEGIIEESIFITGNTIVDAIKDNLAISEYKVDILDKLNLTKANYFLATAHREENVDNMTRLKSIIQGLDMVSQKFGIPIIFPIHPRTKKRISQFNLNIPNSIQPIESLGFLEFLQLEKYAKSIFTDSGGVQIEACALEVPCITMRDETEWVETIQMGANILSGTISENILKSSIYMQNSKRDWENPFGDGCATQRILNLIEQ